jgi:hypothetical protein
MPPPCRERKRRVSIFAGKIGSWLGIFNQRSLYRAKFPRAAPMSFDRPRQTPTVLHASEGMDYHTLTTRRRSAAPCRFKEFMGNDRNSC